MIKSAYERVRIARGNNRPTGLDLIKGMFSEFVELHGDRRFADDPAIVGGIAFLKGCAVTVIAIEKGHGVKDRAWRRCGAPNPEGYRKALRLMKQAEKFKRPIVCFVDTSGAYCGIDAEERGQGQAIAENLYAMMGFKVPILSIIIGEGGSGGALALAVANRVWMFENAVYSVISPEGCAAILFKNAAAAADAAENMKITAADSLENGLIEKVIDETGIGTETFYASLADMISEELKELSHMTGEELTLDRYRRFREIGRFSEEGA